MIRTLELADESQTLAAAARVARALDDERGPLFLSLRGTLGAGKTTFVRGLLRALGVTGSVRSPSFTLVEEYAANGWETLHLDLYRLAAGDDLATLGIRERYEGRLLLLVEWPERAAVGALPPADLALELFIDERAHRVDARAGTDAGERLLGALLQKPSDDSALSPRNA